MNTLKMFFLLMLTGVQSIFGLTNPNNTPQKDSMKPAVIISPSISPLPTNVATATPTMKPTPKPTQTATKTYSEVEILKIYLEYNHEQCLADQIPLDPDGTGTTQFNALVASDRRLIAKYGIDKNYLSKYSSAWYKTNRTYFNKIVEAGKAPCPIISP